MPVRLFFAAVALTLLIAATLHWRASGVFISARLLFERGAFAGTPELTKALGGALTTAETARIESVARQEVERALAGLRIRFTDGRAFWTVRVVPTVNIVFGRRILDAAGATYAFGMLGGTASVNFTTLATNAVLYAPPDATRERIVDAMGRGVGRSAVHEFAHMIAGAGIHSENVHSYEYTSAQRAAQYYGELRWDSAWPMLERKIGQ
jgi:hypothetical protein